MPSNTADLADAQNLLRAALDQLVRAEITEGEEAEIAARAAAWRLADAGLLLRRAMAFEGMVKGTGIDEPTGRGAILPIAVTPSAASSGAAVARARDWTKVPKNALVDSLRHFNLGPSNLSRQDKSDLVKIAVLALRQFPADRAAHFHETLDREIEYQRHLRSEERGQP